MVTPWIYLGGELSAGGEVEVSEEARGGGRRMRGSLCLLGVGGLRVVEVSSAAVGVVVRHVDGGSVQVEVAAARAVGGEAADRTATPGRSEEDKLKPLMLQQVVQHFFVSVWQGGS